MAPGRDDSQREPVSILESAHLLGMFTELREGGRKGGGEAGSNYMCENYAAALATEEGENNAAVVATER